MRKAKKRSLLALMLAVLMVMFVLPGNAWGNIPGQENSVPFKGTLHYGAWVTCDIWQVAAGERFDTEFTGSLDLVLDLVAEHRVLPDLTGEPEACAWEDTPIVHEHFVGSVTFDLLVEPAEKCPKKGPKSGCNQSEDLSGTFTVDLADTPFDGTWTGEDFGQSWWGANRYNGTYMWTEPIIPVPQH